jgi:hypothetical protein
VKNNILIAVFIVLLIIAGCKKDENPISPETGETGIVTGQVFAKNGVEKIQGALVAVANMNNAPQSYTDLNGSYTLINVPSGNQTLSITKGIFQSSVTLEVAPNSTVTAPAAKLEAAGKLGFIDGSYDNIQHIIRDNLGYSIDSLTAADLTDAAVLANYKAIFLNCGSDESPIYNGTGLDVLKTFIHNGGSLYASDWAGVFVQTMFPNNLSLETTGMSQVITAKVIDTGLKEFIGKENVEINFDLGSWAEIISADPSVNTLIQADYYNHQGTLLTNKPLAVNFSHGSGKVIYTTFHNEVNVTSDAVKVLIGFLYSL